MRVEMIVENHSLEMQAEMIVESHSLEMQVEIIVEIHSLEIQVDMIIGTQPQGCLCRDDTEYCYIETPVEIVVEIQQYL